VDPDVARLVERFGLANLPVEGTFFVNTYRSAARTAADGPLGTAGVGLYAADPPSRSLFHRLTCDELWHAYGGDPLRLVLLHPDGRQEEVVLGGDVVAGARVTHLVPAGTWQAGELVPGGRWALFGCTCVPGFTAAAFEGGRQADLLRSHPAAAADIERLGVPDDEAAALPDGYAG
jgi:predicted cupin superfamily sugar epimerase